MEFLILDSEGHSSVYVTYKTTSISLQWGKWPQAFLWD